MKIWQYAVLLHPTEKERESGRTAELVLPVTAVLAVDQNGAVMQAARAIPAEYMDKADRLEVAVRPFKGAVAGAPPSAPARSALENYLVRQFPEGRVDFTGPSTGIAFHPASDVGLTGSANYLNLSKAIATTAR